MIHLKGEKTGSIRLISPPGSHQKKGCSNKITYRTVPGYDLTSTWVTVLPAGTSPRSAITEHMQRAGEIGQLRRKQGEIDTIEFPMDGFRCVYHKTSSDRAWAFPLPEHASRHSADVVSVERWKEGGGGYLVCNISGMPVCAFDVMAPAHRKKMVTPTELEFSALAYSLRVSDCLDLRAGDEREGVFVPASMYFRGENAPDCYAAVMPVMKKRGIDLAGRAAWVLWGPLFFSNSPFMLPVTVLESNISGDVPRVGESVFFVAWLQCAPPRG